MMPGKHHGGRLVIAAPPWFHEWIGRGKDVSADEADVDPHAVGQDRFNVLNRAAQAEWVRRVEPDAGCQDRGRQPEH